LGKHVFPYFLAYYRTKEVNTNLFCTYPKRKEIIVSKGILKPEK
jgi:hypothetical protein